MSVPLAQRFNGAPLDAAAAATLAASRGLHYGDGVFRTLLRHGGRIIDREGQLAKLVDDAARLGMRPPALRVLANDLEALAVDQAQVVLKLVLTRHGSARGYRSTETECDRLASVHPLPHWPETHWTQGITAFRTAMPLATQPVLAGIKHLNRLEQVLATRDWPEGCEEGMLCDDTGRPVCGTRSNLFWIKHGVLHTPSLTRCGVAGRMRERVLTLAATLGLPARIDLSDWTELMAADEAFVTNSLIGLWPLRQLGARTWEQPGPLTQALMQALDHPWIALP